MKRLIPVDESWVQIGKLLREAREKADMSVDDIVFKARIPRTVVEALEAEDFSVFTSPTYAKSFLRQYSDYLKVDAGQWLNALEPASYVSGEAWQPMFAGGPPVGAPRDSRRSPQESQAAGGNKWSAAWLMILTAGLVLALVGLYQKFEQQFGKDDSHPPTAAAIAPPAAPASPKISTTVPGAHPVSPEPSAQPKKEEPAAPAPRAIIVRD